METGGMGAREQPLQLIITTASANVSGPCYAAVVEARRVLEGVVEEDELFALMYGIDPGDDWTTEAALIKANPNYEVSVKADFLLRAQQDAVNNARKGFGVQNQQPQRMGAGPRSLFQYPALAQIRCAGNEDR